MKHRDSRHTPDPGFSKGKPEGIAWVAGLFLAGMIVGASAQPAASEPKSDEPKKDKVAVSPKTKVAPPVTTPSRYVSGEELAAYVESMTSMFSIKKRATDPFGQVQDPDAKPVFTPPPDQKKLHRPTPVQATPLVDIVRLIKVTTIMPMEKRFLIGTRSIGQGQRFPVTYRSKNINLEVVSVTSRQITFRNIESGETASLDLNLLPKGMSSGSGNITAPGMIRDAPNAPLSLDGGSMPFDDSQNR